VRKGRRAGRQAGKEYDSHDFTGVVPDAELSVCNSRFDVEVGCIGALFGA
jgi:hypothetical protein